ncbi:MAG: hypothetical protein RSB70_04765 [Clostridium sp.]
MKTLKKILIPMFLLCALLLSSCSGISNISSKQQNKFINDLMTSFKEQGFQTTTVNFFGADSNSLENDLDLSSTDLALYDCILNNMNYNIEGISTTDTTSTVLVDITTIDVSAATISTMKKIAEENSSSQDLNSTEDYFRKSLITYIQSGSANFMNQKIQFVFIKENKSWVLQWFDDENLTKLLGGLSEK